MFKRRPVIRALAAWNAATELVDRTIEPESHTASAVVDRYSGNHETDVGRADDASGPARKTPTARGARRAAPGAVGGKGRNQLGQAVGGYRGGRPPLFLIIMEFSPYELSRFLPDSANSLS